MGAVFFLLITSIGLIMRFLGKDLLKINKNKTISTYWIDRDKPKKTILSFDITKIPFIYCLLFKIIKKMLIIFRGIHSNKIFQPLNVIFNTPVMVERIRI